MTYDEIRTLIIKRRKNGESYGDIAKDYNISRPSARRIFLGLRVGKKTRDAIGVGPPKKLLDTRERRRDLNKIAIYWGYENWSNYETQILKNFDGNFDWSTKTWKDN